MSSYWEIGKLLEEKKIDSKHGDSVAIYANIRINGFFFSLNPKLPLKLLKLLKLFPLKICKSANFIVPLHCEPALGMSAHQRRRVADIIKGVYWRLFWSVEIRKIS